MYPGNKEEKEKIMKTRLIITGILLAIMLVAIPLGCSKTVTKTVTSPPVTITASAPTIPVTTYLATAAPPDQDEVIIVIGGGYADPIAYVNVGQEFIWLNTDHEAHTVTSASIEYGQPDYFDFTLQPGESVQFIIHSPGVYVYSDTLNPSEVAEIIAQ